MLNERSKQIRRDTIRLSEQHGGYHYGGSFSCVEILIAIFDHVADWSLGDNFILSKGHSCWPYYVLLREMGLSPKLEGHPVRDPHNGVPCTTGSLGHGLPIGVGMAMAKKLKGEPGRVFVLMGDGECQEGTTWESLLIVSKQVLPNLTIIVDENRIQGSGFLDDILPVGDVGEVAQELGLEVFQVQGHKVDTLVSVLRQKSHNATFVVAGTMKGYGVSFMENKPEWHARWLDPEHRKIAMEELR